LVEHGSNHLKQQLDRSAAPKFQFLCRRTVVDRYLQQADRSLDYQCLAWASVSVARAGFEDCPPNPETVRGRPVSLN
jgi:hypothetical protein